jgi:hypothetical protein
MWNGSNQGKPKYSEKKTAPVKLSPPQIPHDLTWGDGSFPPEPRPVLWREITIGSYKIFSVMKREADVASNDVRGLFGKYSART